MPARPHRLLLPLIALAAILPYLPALNAPFLLWDDAANFAQNPHWRGLSFAHLRWMATTMQGGPYQPLSWLSAALNFALWGENPAAMRAVNLALHSASAVLLYLVVEDLFALAAPASAAAERRLAAAFAALSWAAHPLRVESVVWLTERRDVLSGFFYLLAVRLYLRAPERPLRPLACYCLAVLSKASVITLPLTLLLLDRWPLRRRAWREKLPYFAISLAAGAAGLIGQRYHSLLPGAELGLGERLAIAVYSLGWYALKTVLPWGLSPYHRVPPGFGPSDPAVLTSALVVLAVAAAAWTRRRRAPAATAAAAQYAIALLPMAGFVRFGHHLVAERYSYLPGLALSAGAGAALWAARRRPRWRGAATAVAASAALGWAGATAAGARVWSGDEPLWTRVLALDPGATLARVNLASYLRSQGRTAEALEQERLAVAEDPSLGEQWNNLGADAVGRESWKEAEGYLRKAVTAKPELAAAHYNLASALGGLGRRAEELRELEAAARLDFDDAHILNNLGVALTRAGHAGRAEAALRRAASRAPTWSAPYHNLGNLLGAQGRHREALSLFDEERTPARPRAPKTVSK